MIAVHVHSTGCGFEQFLVVAVHELEHSVVDQDIPVGARLLAIADAYDSMTVARGYREPLSRDAAFAELRRCSGTQFDPGLVEPFIAAVDRSEFQTEFHLPQAPAQDVPPIDEQVEQIVRVVQKLEFKTLDPLIERLETTAAARGFTAVHEIAQELKTLTGEDFDLVQLIEKTNELLNLCPSSQTVGAKQTNLA